MTQRRYAGTRLLEYRSVVSDETTGAILMWPTEEPITMQMNEEVSMIEHGCCA